MAELYPPAPSPELVDRLYRVATNDLDSNGNFVLRRSLSPMEKEEMQTRLAVVNRYLVPGVMEKTKQAVMRMMVSYNKAMTSQEAAVIAAQFYSALSGLPLWCIERAVMKFCAAEVKPDDLGQKTINHGIAPTSAQLRVVAIGILRPFGEEATRLRMTLRGSSPREISADERARVAAGLVDLAAGLGATAEQVEAAHAEAVAARRKASDLEVLKAEYAAAGLEPHSSGASLEMMIRCGWSIATMGDGQKQLVRLATQEAPPSAPETKREQKTTARRVDQSKSFSNIVDELEQMP